MTPHVNILDERESIRNPLFGSLALHVSVTAAVISYSLIQGRARPTFGSSNSGGPGTVAVNVVNRINLPSRPGLVNPVANDTQASAPQPPPKIKEQKRVPPAEPDATAIRGRDLRKPQYQASSAPNRFRQQQQDRPNQIYNASGPALVSPMLQQTGSGGIGVGIGSPFGNRYGYYVDLLRQRVADKWRAGDVDPRVHTAPPAVVTFTILRDGSVRNLRIAQGSGIYALDTSAQRAIYDSAPFPPLPAGFERNDATIEFWFQLNR